MMSFSLIALVIGVFFIVVIIALIILVVWAARRTSTGGMSRFPGQASAPQSPKEILQARYARGEITREQYQEMLRDLDM